MALGRCGYIKDKTIQGRVTVFLSGKMISTGATSVLASINQLENAMDSKLSSFTSEGTGGNLQIQKFPVYLNSH
jgi:TATA-box binding protein (TBP) (component of TFIID and TFIIIB)